MNLRFVFSQTILLGCAVVVLWQVLYQLINGEPMPHGHEWDYVGELRWEAGLIVAGIIVAFWSAWDYRKLESVE